MLMKGKAYRTMVQLVLLGAFICVCQITTAQTSNDFSRLEFKTGQSGVVITGKVEHCTYPSETNTEFDYLLISIANNNDFPVEVQFDKVPYINAECKNCTEPKDREFTVLKTLKPGEKISGKCERTQGNSLRSFVAMSQHVTKRMTHFRIENLEVTPKR